MRGFRGLGRRAMERCRRLESGSYCLGMRSAILHETVTHSVVGAFFEVYNSLGFGFLEVFYSRALERELIQGGHKVDREAVVSVCYKGSVLGEQRLDMVVDDKVIIDKGHRQPEPRCSPATLELLARHRPRGRIAAPRQPSRCEVLSVCQLKRPTEIREVRGIRAIVVQQ